MPGAFASRLACKNQCNSLQEFAADVGIDVNGLLRGDSEAIGYLCQIASLPENAFAQSTLLAKTKFSTRLGSEEYGAKLFARRNVRFCPACIAADIGEEGPPWHAVHRLHWQITLIQNCSVHGCPLVTANPADTGIYSFDPSAVFLALSMSGLKHDVLKLNAINAFDKYLSDRAYCKQKPCWPDNLSLFHLWKASTALGLLIEQGCDAQLANLERTEEARLANIGFEVMQGGPRALRRFWNRYTFGGTRSETLLRYSRPRFGAFHKLMASSLEYQAGFSPLRDVYRDYLVNTFQYGEGTVVLGKRVEKRRLHSVLSAQRAIGSRAPLLQAKLIEEGFAVRTSPKMAQLIKPLSIEKVMQIERELGEVIHEIEAAEMLGTCVTTLRTLTRDGIGPASEVTKKAKHRAFSLLGLSAWKKKLLGDPPAIASIKMREALLTRAPSRLNCDTSALVALLLDRTISPIGLFQGQRRFDHIVIDIEHARAALPAIDQVEGIRRTPAFRLLRINNSTLNFLIEQSLLVTFRSRNPDTRLITEYVCPKSVRAFNSKYISLGILAHSEGVVGGPQLIKLKKLGMEPVINQVGLSKIYCRSELDLPYRDIGLDLDI